MSGLWDQRFADLRADLKSCFAEVGAEFKAEISGLRKDLKYGEFGARKALLG